MRITKTLIESLKATYRLMDWKITVRKSKKKTSDQAHTWYRDAYRSASIELYPKQITAFKREFSDESQLQTLHHEFAEIVMAMHEGVLPDEIQEHPKFVEYKDRVADHMANIVIGVLK